MLLTNAHKHGDDKKPILVNVCSKRTNTGSVLDILSIHITSTVADEMYSESKQRILKAIESEEAGIDMVTEGYTGIKKVQFITRTSEGNRTLRCDANDDARELKLSFSFHAETARESSTTVIAP